MISWIANFARRRPAGSRLRQVSLALALVFAQVLDPPTQHLIEAKETKQQGLPAPGDPPPEKKKARPPEPSARRRRRPRR